MKKLLKGGVVINAHGRQLADVLIDGEKIEAVAPHLSCPGAEVIDVSGKLLFPGFIDAHTHFDLDVCNTTTADDFFTGGRSALRGGTTMVIDFACPNKGETLQYGLALWHKKADGKTACDYGFHMTIDDWNEGIIADLPKMFDIKQKRRARISVYADEVEGAEYVPGCKNIWNVKCDIAHPCASQNEMDEKGAQALVDNGCMAVFEGANMPLTPEAIAVVQQNGLLYSPGKASNAGGVATSGLEMSQNSIRMSWSFEEVDEKLQGIMKNIYQACYAASVECGKPGDLMVGANVAGFLKVAEAMMAQGIV